MLAGMSEEFTNRNFSREIIIVSDFFVKVIVDQFKQYIDIIYSWTWSCLQSSSWWTVGAQISSVTEIRTSLYSTRGTVEGEISTSGFSFQHIQVGSCARLFVIRTYDGFKTDSEKKLVKILGIFLKAFLFHTQSSTAVVRCLRASTTNKQASELCPKICNRHSSS